jgi:hypothetical protein
MKPFSDIQSKLLKVKTSFCTLFLYPYKGELQMHEFDSDDLVKVFFNIISCIENELNLIKSENKLSLRIFEKIELTPDSIDHINNLISNANNLTLADILIAGILNIMTAGRLFEIDSNIDIEDDNLIHFQFRHAEILTNEGISLISEYFNLIGYKSNKNKLMRIQPGFDDFIVSNSFFNPNTELTHSSLIPTLQKKAQEIDIFKTSRVFRYVDNDFFPAELASIRNIDDFFGYKDARQLFKLYFKTFSENGDNHPLLIASLPGLGKTHFTISHSLSFENLTLIISEPTELGRPLEKLIRRLSLRKNRKFVIFFDDVDTRKVDWYYFRTHIGGSFVLPENITIVIASNFEFPANISSRGRGFTFPIFDEIQCQLMVEDFLISMGMHHPNPNLVSVIAADYVEEFGQKRFAELSPRTLVRYLDRYNNDPKKRLKMLKMSQEEMVAKPDSQCFYNTNKALQERLEHSV